MGPLQLTNVITIKAAAAITSGQAIGATGSPAAAGAPIVGIAVFDAAAGDPITVATSGSVVEAIAGAGIPAGQALEVGANGRLVRQITGAVVALALTAAAADGDKLLVHVQ